VDTDDPELDALLRRAAPDGAPPGLAERVVVAVKARRRRRRVRLVALGVAAAVAACVALCIALARPPGDGPATPDTVHVTVPDLSGTREAAPATAVAPESFAVQLQATGASGQRVMMARIDGRCVLVVRPDDEMADALDELFRLPTAMAGCLSAEPRGAAMAAQLK